MSCISNKYDVNVIRCVKPEELRLEVDDIVYLNDLCYVKNSQVYYRIETSIKFNNYIVGTAIIWNEAAKHIIGQDISSLLPPNFIKNSIDDSDIKDKLAKTKPTSNIKITQKDLKKMNVLKISYYNNKTSVSLETHKSKLIYFAEAYDKFIKQTINPDNNATTNNNNNNNNSNNNDYGDLETLPARKRMRSQ